MSERTCAQCGRVGTKAFRRYSQPLVGRTIELWRCSNVGACGMRDLPNGLCIIIEARLAALRASA